jgi:hypothetical protein
VYLKSVEKSRVDCAKSIILDDELRIKPKNPKGEVVKR